MTRPLIKATPWDAAVFDMPTWELTEYSENALIQAAKNIGHYTLKVDPLVDKRLLHECGFYYCDTLIEPICSGAQLRVFQHDETSISKEFEEEKLLAICHGAFSHGRFHRDFNLPKACADLRYDNWLKQLIETQRVYGLYWQETLVGFIAYSDNKLLLHALSDECRGKGLAKYWWYAVCSELLKSECDQVTSSISVTNLAVVNLYASLGFSFSSPLDIYHYLVR